MKSDLWRKSERVLCVQWQYKLAKDNSSTSHHALSDMSFSWTNVIFLVLTAINYIFWNKLTVRCCRQWLVWPTGRSGGRHGVWRTVQTHDAFDQHHPSMRNTFSYQLGKWWPDQSFQKWSTFTCIHSVCLFKCLQPLLFIKPRLNGLIRVWIHGLERNNSQFFLKIRFNENF